jgi:hypothetical protein
MLKLPKGRIILWTLVVILLFWDVSQRSKMESPIRHAGSDFLGYWASAQLFFRNENPYDPSALYPIEKSNGIEDSKAIIAWIPPWAHILLSPFEFLPFKAARISWFLFSVAVLLWTAAALWKLRGAKEDLWIPWLAALLFVPGAMSLNMGSAAPLVLAGIACFIWAIRRKSDLIAGLACVLIGIKPHVVYLFWFFLILWVMRARRWKVLFALAGGFLSLAVLAWLVNPGVYSSFLQGFFSNNGQQIWETPTLSTIIRKSSPYYDCWLQFLPAALGLLSCAWLWRGWRNDWDWHDYLIPIALISVITTPYLWPGDFVVLLPVVLLILFRLKFRAGRRWYCAGGLFLMEIVMALQLYISDSHFYLFWVAPALVLIYFLSNRITQDMESRLA